MEIVIIGTGNAATVLGRALKGAGHDILQVVGRHADATASLAAALDAAACSDIKGITANAAFYLLAVSDNALTGLSQQLRLPNRLVAHTAGSVSKDVLQEVSTQYGVFYPLQTLRKEILALPEIPLLVDGNTEAVKEKLFTIAQTISPGVSEAGDHQRLQLHLAAVVVNNFTNYLYSLAESYCKENGLAFGYLLPLIKETAARLETSSPQQVQTGPAIRHDTATIQRHLALLENTHPLKEVYELLTHELTRTRANKANH